MQLQLHFEQPFRAPAKTILVTLSADGLIRSLSVQVAQITGWNEVDWLGKPFHSFLHPDEFPRVKASYVQILKGEMVNLEGVRCYARNGSFQTWVLSLVPDIQNGILEVLVLGRLEENETPSQRSPSSHPQHLAQLYSDTENIIAIQNLESAGLPKLMESLLANAPVGFALLDEELQFVCLNQTFSGMTGFAPQQQLGQPLKNLLPNAAHLLEPMLRDILATGKPLIDHEIVLQRAAFIERSRYALISFYPIPDGHGGTCGVALIALDITDRKRSEERLKKVSEELMRSNQALEAFSSIASHDLKEPLRTVGMFVALLERKYQGIADKETQDYIHYVVNGVSRMQRLIDKILEYSTAGKVRAEFSNVDCTKILQTILANLKVSLEESQCSVTFDPLPTVTGDEFLLLPVFQNLIANAIKYKGSDPPHIHVGVKRELNTWVFSVTDNGLGISTKHFSNIFLPFRKLHSQSEYAGSGLGLAICQKNVERHGGKIWVTSQEGKGSTFCFTIPVGGPP